jgi:hypothetical protein
MQQFGKNKTPPSFNVAIASSETHRLLLTHQNISHPEQQTSLADFTVHNG